MHGSRSKIARKKSRQAALRGGISFRTFTHTLKPNKPVDPQLATSQQLELHATHIKKLLV
jgi:hypothetical protein